ncbi:MAG: AIR synthase-related protein, partial [Actinomycetota bacterium]|nr:AIR synthase-related protein [Actinomycetota bacterium]
LHDISDGGLAVAVAETCIASGVGATLVSVGPDEMFSEDPHRFIAVFEPGVIELPEDLARKVGTMAGDSLMLGESGPIEVDTLRSTWGDAIPRRMAG